MAEFNQAVETPVEKSVGVTLFTIKQTAAERGLRSGGRTQGLHYGIKHLYPYVLLGL
jgi:hypothetical protein